RTKVFLRSLGDDTGGNPAQFDINWGGELSYVNIDDIQIGNNNLTVAQGPGATVSLSNVVNGVGNEMQEISQTGGGAFALSFGGFPATTQVGGNPTATTLQNYLNTISSGTSSFQGLPSGINTLNGNVAVFGPTGGPY